MTIVVVLKEEPFESHYGIALMSEYHHFSSALLDLFEDAVVENQDE